MRNYILLLELHHLFLEVSRLFWVGNLPAFILTIVRFMVVTLTSIVRLVVVFNSLWFLRS
jgi:hypothetical protein